MEHHILYSIFDSTENENLSVQFKNKRSIIFFIQFLTQLKTKISQYNLKIKEEGRKKKHRDLLLVKETDGTLLIEIRRLKLI
jgi:hypothetical protein